MATEKWLIDANEAYEIARTSGLHDDFGRCMADLTSLRELLEDVPTVDAVEVVRCRDCKHYMTVHCTCDGCCISDDWYCADGERRTAP